MSYMKAGFETNNIQGFFYIFYSLLSLPLNPPWRVRHNFPEEYKRIRYFENLNIESRWTHRLETVNQEALNIYKVSSFVIGSWDRKMNEWNLVLSLKGMQTISHIWIITIYRGNNASRSHLLITYVPRVVLSDLYAFIT